MSNPGEEPPSFEVITTAELQQVGWSLAYCRLAEERGLPIEWSNPRTRRRGWVLVADLASYFAGRFERSSEQLRQRELRAAYCARKNSRPVPRFLQESD